MTSGAADETVAPDETVSSEETVELPETPAPEQRSLRSRLRRNLGKHEQDREDPHQLLPSTRYRYVRELGRGGMGTVLEAEDVELGRRVAIKTVVGDEPARLARFRREARLASQLEHPNIVPVYDLHERDDGSASLAMRVIEGQSLRQVIDHLARGQGELGQARLLEIVVGVGQAVAYAHAQGVIHRDIKPANVMLGRFGQVFLTDFGLAKRLGEDDALESTGDVPLGESFVSVDGLVVGTPAYMAPEQASGQADQVDAQTDVYSLGALFYELLTLTRPFTSTNTKELLDAAQRHAPEPPRRRAPDRSIPRELGAIALKALSKDKASRYATAEALLDDVRAFQEGRAVSAFRDPFTTRVLKWSRRHRLLVATLLTGLLVTGLSVMALIAERDRARGEELARLQRRQQATVPYLTGMDLLRRRLDIATIGSRAVPALEQAVALDPEFAEARFALGLAWLRCFDADRALSNMEAALAQQPHNAHWLVQLGQVYQLSLSPRDPKAARSRERARSYFLRAAELGTSVSPFAQVGQAMVLVDDGQTEEARELLEQVTREAPHLWEAWHALGYVQLKSDPEAAEAAFRRALSMEPDEVRAVRGVAAALLGQGRYEPALALSRRAADLGDPSLAIDLVNLGHALFQLEQHEEAVSVLREAIAREPDTTKAHVTLGAALHGLGRHEEALASFTTAIEHDDGSVGEDAFQGRGSVLMTLGRIQEALDDYEVALQEGPEVAQNWANRAFARMQLGLLDEARADLDQALERDPTLTTAWANLAGVYQAQGDEAAAEAALTSGIECDPQSGQLWLFRGQIRLYDGREAEAASDLEQALEVGGSAGAPLPPEAVVLLLRAYRRTGQHAEVLALLEQRGAELPERLRPYADGEGGLAHFAVAQELCVRHAYPEALPHLERSFELEPQEGNATVAAEVTAQLGRLDESFTWLERAYQCGWRDPALLERPSLAPLRADPRFAELRARLGQ